MIQIKNLHVSVDSKPILKGLDLEIAAGTTHAIMGPNGSGKSTLAHALIGNPLYIIDVGSLIYQGVDITLLTPDERARRGIFLAFQQPPAIPGISVLTFLKEIYAACGGTALDTQKFSTLVESYVSQVGIRKELLSRMLNDGFSGGEKKQFEMLQILLLKPQLIILDEIDSGLDIDALRAVATAICFVRAQNPQVAVIIITHYQRILQYLIPDQVHIISGGSIVRSGGAELVVELEQKGYDAYRSIPR